MGSHDVKPLPKPTVEISASKPGEIRTIVLAGGCFWCTEGAFAQFKGVKDVTSGYAGDTKDTANYRAVCTGKTKQAEAIKITYDAGVISYSQLLQIFFLAHDPTTKDRQGNDAGPQYRSAIFCANDDERKVAESYIKQLNDAKTFDSPIVTTIEPLTEFFPAEAYHQDYVANNPNEGYVRACAIPKMNKVREAYAEWLKD
ncbi:MAG: peptide-methionine (S)-S-oxide reductase MsrA [Anaerolineae bacterium]|nr:peptide-methionine (S)-S-oxide reductase MsrA [Phycisphaerae bacterium]